MFQAKPKLHPSRLHKKTKVFSLRKIWQLRYRFYAFIVIVVTAPLLFAADKSIPEDVPVNGLGYEALASNTFYTQIRKVAVEQTVAKSDTDPGSYVLIGNKIVVYDKAGRIITELLKDQAGINMGFIFSQPFVDFGADLGLTPEKVQEVEKKIDQQPADTGPKPLDQVVKTPATAQFKNLLLYDKYKIRVPIIYTTFDDLFEKRADGSFDFTKPRDTNDTKSPVQQKLIQGVVHLAYTPQPGELGNCYIVGHSSNYSFIQSPYNTVFKPLESRSQPGEDFTIFDRFGRELHFRTFETLKIADNDVSTAYKNYSDQRVCTLQTSILGIRNGRWEAVARWLTRGVLIDPATDQPYTK
ncbi:MAG: sortase [bacterium]